MVDASVGGNGGASCGGDGGGGAAAVSIGVRCAGLESGVSPIRALVGLMGAAAAAVLELCGGLCLPVRLGLRSPVRLGVS